MADLHRPLRADAKRNQDLLVEAAKAAFSEHGANASLEDVAKRAGVGIGTLYRNFPPRDDLIACVLSAGNVAIVARATELLTCPRPAEARAEWLRALVDHVATYRGLIGTVAASFVAESGTSLCATCDAIQEAGARLLARAQMAGAIGLRARAIVNPRAAGGVRDRELQVERLGPVDRRDLELTADLVVGLEQVELELVAIDGELEQLERALEDRPVLVDAAAHRRYEPIDVELVALRLRHHVDPVAIDQQLLLGVAIEPAIRLVVRARAQREDSGEQPGSGLHSSSVAETASGGGSHAGPSETPASNSGHGGLQPACQRSPATSSRTDAGSGRSAWQSRASRRSSCGPNRCAIFVTDARDSIPR